MHQKNIITAGKALTKESKVLIMIHGRGGSAEDILTLAAHLDVNDFSLLAPQATNHTWYPYSFLAPQKENEPWLSSALAVLKELVEDVETAGVPASHIYFLGFSQGACLMLEFLARNAARFGGAVAFTGGLIGEVIEEENYKGDFGGMRVFIGSSDPDPHVPVARVKESTRILSAMNALVEERIYPGMGHTISKEEIDRVNSLIFSGVEN
jgi:phospholipase/carboxylesterase